MDQSSGSVKRSVLLVEDEVIIAMEESFMLKSGGFDVITVNSGEEAVAAATGTIPPPDIILMDIDLGKGIDGAEAARRILRVKEIPILFLSSHTESDIVKKTEEISSYGYLVKSAGETVLLASIRMAFRLHDARMKIIAKNMEIEQASEELIQSEEELVQSSQELEQSEQRFRLLVENSFDGIFIQINGKFAYCNNAARTMFGVAETESIIGRDVIKNFAPESRDNVAQRIEILNHERRAVPRIEERILRIDGIPVDVEVYAVPISLPDGNGALVYMTDLTARKEIERKIREKDALLDSMSSMAHMGGWEFDVKTLKGTWTEEVARIHDLDPVEQTDVSHGIQFYTEESRSKIENALKEAVSSGTPYDLVLELISAKGIHKWIRTIGKAVRANGVIVKITGTFQDITDAKNAADSIKEKNEKFSAIVELTSDCIVRFAEDFSILSANATATEIMGVHTSATEMTLLKESGISEELYRQLESRISHVFATGETAAMDFEINTAKGRMSFDLKLWPEFGTARKVVSVIGVARDVTHRARVERETTQLAAQFQTMFMNHKAVMLLIEPETGRIFTANHAASAYYGYPMEVLCSKNIHDINRLPKEAVSFEMKSALEEDRNYFIFPHHLQNGEVRTVEVYSSPIEIGTQKLLFSIIHDITDRKKTEAALSQLLDEKEILFKELQHRVKNSLSVVSGLLTLELDSITDNRARDVLLNAKSRIMSISRVYESLSRTSGIDHVEVGSYMKEFIGGLYSSYVTDPSRITFSTSVESFRLDLREQCLSVLFSTSLSPTRSNMHIQPLNPV